MLVLSLTGATASELYNQLLSAKTQLFQTSRPGPGLGLWAKQTNERLMSVIEGTWVDLGYTDLGSEETFRKACRDYGMVVKRENNYSFVVTSHVKLGRREGDVSKEYIFKSGISYNFRWNIDQQMKIFGDDEPNGPKVLQNANGTSALLMTTPNTMVEADFATGIPFLWGRCPMG
jgi:hypothetical protein